MKNLFTLLLLLLALSSNVLADHGPRIQFIHNSASEEAASVDIWAISAVTLGVYPPYKVIDSLSYKEASSFITFSLIYGDLIFYVTEAGSADTSNYFFQKTLVSGTDVDYEETFLLIATGEPGENFDMVLTDGRETPQITYNTSVKVFHGSVGAPNVNISEVSIPAGVIVEDLAYGEAQGYLNLDAEDIELQVQTTSGLGVAEFSVPLNDFANYALAVLATGYLDTTGITANNPFKLLIVTPEGEVFEIDPNQGLTSARIQVIHNSADDAASLVDVWLNDSLLLDDFSFRTATPFIDAPGGEEFTIAIKGSDSMDSEDPIWSQDYILASAETYILVAEGIVSQSGYDPSLPFDIAVYNMGRETGSSSNKTDVLVHHGSSDAPTVDVYEVSGDEVEIINDLMYADFAGYLELVTQDYILEIRDESGENAVAAYQAPLATLGLEGEALTVIASGFLDPSNNSEGPAFGLWVALASGGDLIELPSINTYVEEEIIDNTSISIFPNPASDIVNLNFDLKEDADVILYMYDVNGSIVKKETLGRIQQANHSSQININDLSNGTYFIRIQAGKTLVNRKIQVF